MFDISDPNTFWLNVTNIALGLVTLICCVAVGRSLYLELSVRLKKRARALATDDHTFLVPELGITMADGGERLDKIVRQRDNNTPPHEDEPHIFRSEN
jgi:hypothetical protein